MGLGYTSRVDAIVSRILQRGRDLNKDAYGVYLTNVSNGILGLIEKPAYKGNSDVRTISKYIVWELENTHNKLSTNEGFFDELLRIIDSSN